MTCKDCIHYDACREYPYLTEEYGWTNPTTHCKKEYENMKEYCNTFEDKALYIKLPCKVEDIVKQARWVQEQFPLPLSDSSKICYACSNCHTHWDLTFKYCPNCGAKMDERIKGL